jgi:hypothetical protein
MSLTGSKVSGNSAVGGVGGSGFNVQCHYKGRGTTLPVWAIQAQAEGEEQGRVVGCMSSPGQLAGGGDGGKGAEGLLRAPHDDA